MQEYDPAYIGAVENIIKITLYGVLKWNIISGSILILTIFTINMDLSSLYILLLICLIDIYSLLSLLHNQPITTYNLTKTGRSNIFIGVRSENTYCKSFRTFSLLSPK